MSETARLYSFSKADSYNSDPDDFGEPVAGLLGGILCTLSLVSTAWSLHQFQVLVLMPCLARLLNQAAAGSVSLQMCSGYECTSSSLIIPIPGSFSLQAEVSRRITSRYSLGGMTTCLRSLPPQVKILNYSATAKQATKLAYFPSYFIYHN